MFVVFVVVVIVSMFVVGPEVDGGNGGVHDETSKFECSHRKSDKNNDDNEDDDDKHENEMKIDENSNECEFYF